MTTPSKNDIIASFSDNTTGQIRPLHMRQFAEVAAYATDIEAIYAEATIAATGTTAGTAAQLTTPISFVSGADDAKGVKLSTLPRQIIYNMDTTHELLIYPATGKTIDGGSYATLEPMGRTEFLTGGE